MVADQCLPKKKTAAIYESNVELTVVYCGPHIFQVPLILSLLVFKEQSHSFI